MSLPTTLLTQAISDQMRKELPPTSWDARHTKAMRLQLRLSTPPTHEGYVTLEIVLFRPMSYTQVWSRVTSTMAPIEGLDDQDYCGLKPGFEYTKSATEWVIHCDHDSCWREALGALLNTHTAQIVLFSGPGDWYEIVDVASLNLPDSREAFDRQRNKRS